MQELAKISRDLIVPVVLLAMVFILKPYTENIDAIQTSYLQTLPLALLGIALIFSWKFNLSQCFHLLFMVYLYFSTLMLMIPQIEQSDEIQKNLIIAAFAIFIPLNFLIFEAWKAPRKISWSKLGHVLLVIIQIGTIYWAIENIPHLITPLFYFTFLPPLILLSEHIPHISIALFMAIFILQGAKIILNQDAVDSAMLITIIALFIDIYLLNLPSIHFLIFSAIGIMICISIIQESFNMAFIDPLTRLPSRRAMNIELKKLGKHYAIAMLDIDHFKKINDQYGHDVGDQVLRKLGKHLKHLTGDGHVSRYGGEEFAVIFSNKSVTEANMHLELLRENISNSKFSIRSKSRPKDIPKNKTKTNSTANEIKVTVSIGIAERNRINRKAEDVQKAADTALYKAKKTGRNKIYF